MCFMTLWYHEKNIFPGQMTKMYFLCKILSLELYFSAWLKSLLSCWQGNCISHIFSCVQATLWMVHSVCLSVRPSVTPSYMPVFRWNVLWYGAVRLSVHSSVQLLTLKNIEGIRGFLLYLVCLCIPSMNLWFIWSYLIKCEHNNINNDFSIFVIHRVIC